MSTKETFTGVPPPVKEPGELLRFAWPDPLLLAEAELQIKPKWLDSAASTWPPAGEEEKSESQKLSFTYNDLPLDREEVTLAQDIDTWRRRGMLLIHLAQSSPVAKPTPAQPTLQKHASTPKLGSTPTSLVHGLFSIPWRGRARTDASLAQKSETKTTLTRPKSRSLSSGRTNDLRRASIANAVIAAEGRKMPVTNSAWVTPVSTLPPVITRSTRLGLFILALSMFQRGIELAKMWSQTRISPDAPFRIASEGLRALILATQSSFDTCLGDAAAARAHVIHSNSNEDQAEPLPNPQSTLLKVLYDVSLELVHFTIWHVAGSALISNSVDWPPCMNCSGDNVRKQSGRRKRPIVSPPLLLPPLSPSLPAR